MGSPYTPNPAAGTWTSVTFPDDGDNKDVASVRVGLEALANKGSRYIDGFGGGDYSPSSAIIIRAAGLDVQGPFNAAAGAAVAGGMNVTGTVNLFDAVHFFGATDFAGFNAVESGATFSFLAGSSFMTAAGVTEIHANDVGFGGTSTFSGPWLSTGTSEIRGALTLTAAASVSNSAIITNAGAGRLRLRRVSGLDSNHTYAIADADVVMVRSGGISADRTYPLGITGASSGDVIRCVNLDPTFKITFNGVAIRSVTGEMYEVSFIFNSAVGAWESLSSSVTP